MIDDTVSVGRTGGPDGAPTRAVLAVLYDPETGRVVAAHTFVGIDDDLSGPGGHESREQVAREAARRHHRVEHLRYVEAAPDLHLSRGAGLHVVDGVVTVRELKRPRG